MPGTLGHVLLSGRMASVISVNLARVRVPGWKQAVGRTGIDKRPTAHRVRLANDQVEGDAVCDVEHHGGYDQAVYAYATEDAAWWAGQLDRVVEPGQFGENLTTEGVDQTGAVIGERWAIGSAVLEVSSPRIPCRTLAGFWEVPHMIRHFTDAGRPGAYLRIITEGDVGTGDRIEVVHRPSHGVTLGETFRALTGDRHLAHRLLEAPELPAAARARAYAWLGDRSPTE
jgi:MOSC domain-containing protein YiiM